MHLTLLSVPSLAAYPRDAGWYNGVGPLLSSSRGHLGADKAEVETPDKTMECEHSKGEGVPDREDHDTLHHLNANEELNTTSHPSAASLNK